MALHRCADYSPAAWQQLVYIGPGVINDACTTPQHDFLGSILCNFGKR